MTVHLTCRRLRCLLAVTLLFPSLARGVEPTPQGQVPAAIANPVSPAAMAEYRRKLEVYLAARQAFDSEAEAYWSSIAEKRRLRREKRRTHEDVTLTDYMLTQPPQYTGPAKPIDPSKPPEQRPPRKPLPVVADFVQAAREHFQFEPQRPASEVDFKRAYAKAAAAAGLTKDQVVRIYGFEAGGNGKYDVQAGREYSASARPISTALGYNQLLTTNTVELVAEQGHEFVAALRAAAGRATGKRRDELEHKIAVLQRMIKFCRSVPDDWSAHDRLANTGQGLGVHAMALDADVGPLLQTHKLLTSVVFARIKGYQTPLTAAELEMMNLTGDGNGFDMVLLPAKLREQIPTANFFQRSGYERNPVAIRNNVVSKLLAATDTKMDKEMTLPGAKDLAAAFDAVQRPD